MTTVRRLIVLAISLLVVTASCQSKQSPPSGSSPSVGPLTTEEARGCQPETAATDQLSEEQVNADLIIQKVQPTMDDFQDLPRGLWPVNLNSGGSFSWLDRRELASMDDHPVARLSQLRSLGAQGASYESVEILGTQAFDLNIEVIFFSGPECAAAFMDSGLLGEELTPALTAQGFVVREIYRAEDSTKEVWVLTKGPVVIQVTIHPGPSSPDFDISKLAETLAGRYWEQISAAR
jgi:hypothetical protein